MHLQGDYIVKPEYLEWQVFFSAFYEENNRGDNTLSNAKYYKKKKKANGDSTLGKNGINGEITTGNFKPYKPQQEEKFVDLGVSLNIKGITKNMSDINMLEVNIPVINTSVINLTEPNSLEIPKIELVGFNPSTPKITTLNFSEIPVLTLNSKGGSNGGITGFFPYGDESGYNSIISQMDLTSGTITVKTGDFSAGYYSYTLDTILGNPSSGLSYSQRPVFDPITSTTTYETAYLPTGVYNNSILNNPADFIEVVQGVLKVIDNPITRIGVVGGNVDDLTITLEGDTRNPRFLEQILQFDEHYTGIQNPNTGKYETYTLDDMEAKGWITSTEKAELGDRFLDTTNSE